MTKKKTLVGWVYVKKNLILQLLQKKAQQEKNEKFKHTNILKCNNNNNNSISGPIPFMSGTPDEEQWTLVYQIANAYKEQTGYTCGLVWHY